VPFNFPAMVPFWFLPFAIACGNTFVLKPSEQVPLTQQIAFEELDSLGLPAGVVNLVNGGRELVEGILEHPGIDAVSFVGSAPVARIVYERAARAAGIDEGIDMGPVISCDARERIRAWIDRGAAGGARIVVDGREAGADPNGAFIGPTILGVAAPVAFFPFSGWKDSFLGDLHAHGTDAVDFYTRKKTVTSRYFSSGQGSGSYFVES
jgi:acyl-CoA reductase-like NAD-dependent aldehyde dehydrogenase